LKIAERAYSDSAANIGTQRQNAAHNAAQVHSLRQFIDFSNPWQLQQTAAQDGMKRHDDGKSLFTRKWTVS
jgi:hypothetical protein